MNRFIFCTCLKWPDSVDHHLLVAAVLFALVTTLTARQPPEIQLAQWICGLFGPANRTLGQNQTSTKSVEGTPPLNAGAVAGSRQMSSNLEPAKELSDLTGDAIGTMGVHDVGALALKFIGKHFQEMRISRTDVNAPAPRHDQLLVKHNLIPPVRTIFKKPEDDCTHWSSGGFNLAHACKRLGWGLHQRNFSMPDSVGFITSLRNHELNVTKEFVHKADVGRALHQMIG